MQNENAPAYVLVTAACNEEKVIEHALRAVTSQTLLPRRWAIVSDCSTDRTDEIIAQYMAQYDFIRTVRITEKHERNFAAQVNAINMGVAQMKDIDYDFIGNIDADIGLHPDYFESLFRKFRQDSTLGLGGGYICDRQPDGTFQSRSKNSVRSVAHAAQMFHRSCFEAVRAYQALPYGGPDTHAEVSARMNGWNVRSFPELELLHYRPTGTAGGPFRNSFRIGLMDYSLGYDPLYEMFKIATRASIRPRDLAHAATKFGGFAYSYLAGKKRPVSKEFVAFLRKEQRERLQDAVLPWRVNRRPVA